MSRFSMLIQDASGAHMDLKEMDKRLEVQRMIDVLQLRASQILRVLLASKDFQQTNACQSSEELYVICRTSRRIIVVDVLTRCPIEQVANFDTYDFVAHPKFEKKITTYTRNANKPNPYLSKCRSWDVALNVILKVEALDLETARLPSARLLFREYTILKYTWECYLQENMELDEMAGIPMVFDYTEVPNHDFNYERSVEYKVIDIFGSLIPWKSENLTTMSCMSMEKLGPNVKFLLELMGFSKRKSPTFDLETSFKVFDQLICRCLQLHRFGVVHNSVEPRNIYFGRSIAFNVVYLADYSKSIIIDSKERKLTELFGGGDPRFVSHLRYRGSPVHPIEDVESSFYTLINMILGNLPWDVHLRSRTDGSQLGDGQLNGSNSAEHPDLSEPQPKVREAKSNFWKSPSGIHRVLADMRYICGSVPESHTHLATEIIKELYDRVQNYFQTLGLRQKINTVSNLMSPLSPDYQFYMELRRTVLLFFRFDNLSATLSTSTYLRKIEAIARDEHQEPRPAWNISNWCFNAVNMSAAGNRPVRNSTDFMARTTD